MEFFSSREVMHNILTNSVTRESIELGSLINVYTVEYAKIFWYSLFALHVA